jgi:hypothetical protein
VRCEPETLLGGSKLKLRFTESGGPLPFARVTELWEQSAAFRDLFLGSLAAAPYPAFFWELPPVTRDSVHRPFECVLVDSPTLDGVLPDREAFAEHFPTDSQRSVVRFGNLSGDAELIVPCPRDPTAACAHLATFARGAPADQQHELLRTVGIALRERVSDRPVWVSTSGLGIFWLHVRLDDRPKYYTHAPYRAPPG